MEILGFAEGLERLDTLDIVGVSIRDGKFVVSDELAGNVELVKGNVLEYIKNKEGLAFVGSGNLENNLLYQEGIDREVLVDFHCGIARSLTIGGIYGFTSNDVFFHHRENLDFSSFRYSNGQDRSYNPKKDLLRQMELSGLSLLFKATMFYNLIGDDCRSISENCGVLVTKGKEMPIPKAHEITGVVSQTLREYNGNDFVEREGTYEEFKESLSEETNIVVMRIGEDTYRYWNITSGNYFDVVPGLASRPESYTPNLLDKVASLF